MFKLSMIENNSEYVKYKYIGDCNTSGTIFVHKITGLITLNENGDSPFIHHVKNRIKQYIDNNNYPDHDIIAIY